MKQAAGQPIGYLLKRVQAALRRQMDAELETHDLSMAQYAVLFNLEDETRLTNAELARRSFVTPQTMIRIVSDLERLGFIERLPDSTNQRRRLTVLTRQGQQRTSAAHATASQVEERMLEGLPSSERDRLRAALEQCLQNIEDPLSPADERDAPTIGSPPESRPSS